MNLMDFIIEYGLDARSLVRTYRWAAGKNNIPIHGGSSIIFRLELSPVYNNVYFVDIRIKSHSASDGHYLSRQKVNKRPSDSTSSFPIKEIQDLAALWSL